MPWWGFAQFCPSPSLLLWDPEGVRVKGRPFPRLNFLSKAFGRYEQSSHAASAGAAGGQLCEQKSRLYKCSGCDIFIPPPTLLLLPQLYEAFTFLKGLGAVILVHAENGDLIAQVSGLMSTLSTPVHVPALSRRDWRGALVSGWLGHEGSG